MKDHVGHDKDHCIQGFVSAQNKCVDDLVKILSESETRHSEKIATVETRYAEELSPLEEASQQLPQPLA